MKAFYCVGTHWDREWYEPFQEYRMWLVELIDQVLEIMDREPEFAVFHLDGQTIVLDDYLEIRPENRQRLVDRINEGRILVGPWYNLPDEWLISGESYIRNLLKGAQVCRELGVEPMDFAYTPDQFGHIAALPMIMSGFGLQAGLIWRGAQDENYPGQFMWVGPDGSRLPYNKLMDKGSYGAFDFLARRPIRDAKFSDSSFVEHFEKYFKEEKDRAPLDAILMLDAIDHQYITPDMLQLFRELRKRYPEIEFLWAGLPEYGKLMADGAAKLEERHGELMQPARDAFRGGHYLIVHTISARYPLKQRNDTCAALLEKWAEPYSLFHAMSGGSPILRYLDRAWTHLLQNHPHDSICGCSVDQVHKDMLYRFDQAEMIADGVIRRAMAAIAPASGDVEHFVNTVVHNPLPYRRSGVFELTVALPTNWPKKYIDGLATSQLLNKFKLLKKDGTPIPFQMRGIDRNMPYHPIIESGRHRYANADLFHLAVELDVPACGYTSFQAVPTDEATRNFGSLMHESMSASNGIIDFTLFPDGSGSLGLGDRVGFDDLFLYEDCGDCGDGWTRGQLVDDIVYRSFGTRVTTGIDEDGPLRTVFRVEREFDLPAEMDRRTWRRSAERRALRVVDRIYVEKGSPCLRVRTRIENNCRDHRFRVLFPTLSDAETSIAETPFAVVERDIAIPSETANWHERVNPEKPFTSFVAVQDADGGLAVLCPFGLHEYEVTQNDERAIALTLFRSFFQTVMTAGEIDGELLGPLEFDYLLYPFEGEFDSSAAARLVAQAQTPVKTHHAPALPDDRSFLECVRGHAVVTAMKPAADGNGGIIRLWNPLGEPSDSELVFGIDLKEAQICNLNESHAAPLALDRTNAVSFTVKPYGLATVRFIW